MRRSPLRRPASEARVHHLIIAVICLNIWVAASVAFKCWRVKRKGCTAFQHRLVWVCVAYVFTRVALLFPTVAPANDDVSVLAAVLADTVLLVLLCTWCRNECRSLRDKGTGAFRKPL